MVDTFSRDVLRICVGQVCQIVGWNSIQSTPLELLTDILQDFLKSLGQSSHNYAELYGQSEPNLDHVALAFCDMGINVTDLQEYVKYVDSSTPPDVPKYPIPKESNLNFLKPGSREVVTRPVHIHEHLPPMHPHLEENELTPKQSPVTIDTQASEATSPLPSPKGSLFKRPVDPLSSETIKRARIILEEEARPLREISSVMMTTSGFLSPAREGKLPEARTPPAPIPEAPPPPKPEKVPASSPPPQTLPPPPEVTPEPPAPKPEKRRKKSKDPSSDKKENKMKEDAKGKDESFEEENEGKVKKLVSVKETSKLKALKIGAIKAGQNAGKAKHLKGKAKAAKSPKVDKPSQDASGGYSEPNYIAEVKLPSEPDKQKLNIFRKISKVKEESIIGADEDREPPSHAGDQWSQVDETIEAVIRKSEQKENEVESMDVEEHNSPSNFDSLYSDDPFILGTPATPKTPDIPKVTEHKKKKKDKTKDKDKKEKYQLSPKNKAPVDLDLLAKPKTPEVDLNVDDTPPPTIFSTFFSPFPTGPGLIPPTLASNPLIPHSMPLPPIVKHPAMMQTMHLPKTPPTPQMPDLDHFIPKPLPAVHTPSTPTVEPMDITPPNLPQPLVPESSKKKEHKKDKKAKDKSKKKKDKKEKSKDKSEKKRLKLEKKEREKAKLKKDKKEKKRDKELTEAKGDPQVGTVPKITFKLGPASPQDSPSEPLHRKIVIKPLIKKEEDTSVKQERVPSPELARISPLMPKPSKHKHVGEGSAPQTVSTSNTFTPIDRNPHPPASVRLDNEGNEVWICPACGGQDDGSPMIGCDGCDAWYHWVCVGIQVPPESSEWFCRLCLSRKDIEVIEKKKKNRKKKLQH